MMRTVRPGRSVSVGELSARENLETHRLEVPRRHLLRYRGRTLVELVIALAFRKQAPESARIENRQPPGSTGGSHTGDGSYSLE